MIYNWHKAEHIIIEELEDNQPTETVVGDKTIGILRKGEDLYAFAATCPHASARFCDGWLDARGHITCPLHKYKFNPVNGRNVSGEGYKLKTFPVEIRAGIVYIGL